MSARLLLLLGCGGDDPTGLAVRDIIHGREVNNIEALANPEALEFFRDLDALE